MKRIGYILVSLWLILIAGCGYTLVGRGSLPRHIKTIAIPIFNNDTLEDGIEDVITREIIDVYSRGGKLRLVDKNEADAVLRGTITSYDDTQAVTYNEQNEASSYRLIIKVDIVIYDLVNDEVYWEIEALSEDADFEGGEDYDFSTEEANKEDALEQLAEELSERVFALSTEGF